VRDHFAYDILLLSRLTFFSNSRFVMRFLIYMCRAEATRRLLGLSLSVTALTGPVETK
jgi:hypothetical protein